jgi:RNA polymerase sigma factor (sigma-70 family)
MGVKFNEHICWDSFVKGDKKSFEYLYNEYFEALIKYASKFSSDQAFIEESVQDLFVKIWQNRERLNAPASVKYYLFKALRNLIYNKLTSTSKEVYIGDESDLLAFDLKMDAADPYDSSESWDTATDSLLNHLTQRQKEAVYLFYVEGLSYKEISDLLNIKVGGTYKLIYRAISAMREQSKDFELSGREITITAKA